VNKIISIADGEISEVGTYGDLMERNGAFSEFIRNNQLEESSSDEKTPKSLGRQLSTFHDPKSEENTDAEKKCKDSKFIEEEDIKSGQVKNFIV
jgi:hypothetical protein